jgi:hypothetical protein
MECAFWAFLSFLKGCKQAQHSTCLHGVVRRHDGVLGFNAGIPASDLRGVSCPEKHVDSPMEHS